MIIVAQINYADWKTITYLVDFVMLMSIYGTLSHILYILFYWWVLWGLENYHLSHRFMSCWWVFREIEQIIITYVVGFVHIYWYFSLFCVFQFPTVTCTFPALIVRQAGSAHPSTPETMHQTCCVATPSQAEGRSVFRSPSWTSTLNTPSTWPRSPPSK